MAGHGAAAVDLDHLSPTQRQALQQFTEMTSQVAQDAIPLLERSHWNVQIAITKFFDGEGPDLLAEAQAAQTPPPMAARHENLQESLAAGALPGQTRRHAAKTDAAPRIVPRPATVWQPPFVLALLMMPFQLGYRAAAGLLRFLLYPVSLLPLPARLRGAALSIRKGWRSSGGRRMLLPRDTAQRFRREFEEEYGAHELPFFDGGAAHALDTAKRDVKFLLIVLISPEHDDTDSFVRETLLSPELVTFINDASNNLILWGGNVLDSEAYQMATEYACTKYPFSCLVSLTPQEGSSTRMGVIKRLAGPMTVAAYIAGLQDGINKYAPQLDGVRAERAAQHMARSLRNEQDSAYERSLARDRERARLRREAAAAKEAAEKAEREKAAAAERQEKLRQEWLRWRASTLAPEPDAGAGDAVRLAIHLVGDTGRVVRMFAAKASLEELYAVVECEMLQQAPAPAGNEKAPVKPEGYEHKFSFRLTSLMPREALEPSETVTIGEKMGRGGTLFVEAADVEDGEEEALGA